MQAKNLYYAFDIAPGFWDVILESAVDGLIGCPMMVYDEIAKGGDDLATWASGAKAVCGGFFIEPDKNTQGSFSTIAEYVVKGGNYHPAQSALFLKGADPWVIACASGSKGVVVTQEKLVGTDSKKVKIPNICKHYGIEYVSCYEMLRRIGRPLKV